jgi:hypothetical protein
MYLIYKKCPTCHLLFPTLPWWINCYCAKHQADFKFMLKMWIQARNLPIHVFDVFDQKGHHVCRNCGGSLLRKDGKYSSVKRYDKPYCSQMGDEIFGHYSWTNVSNHYIYELWGKQCKDPVLGEAVKGGLMICEECHALCKAKDDCWNDNENHYPTYALHHKVPVYFINETNWELVWDTENLICLCADCHKTKHDAIWEQKSEEMKGYNRRQTEKFWKSFAKLDTFIK